MSIETILQLLAEQKAQNKLLQDQLRISQAQQAEQLELIKQLSGQIEKFQRMLFGHTSERLQSKKGDKNKKKSSNNKTTTSKGSDNKNGRRSLPKDLPREKEQFDIPEDQRFCSNCDCKLHCIGKDISEQLDLVPLKLFVRELIRYKYACRFCKQVVVAEMPEQPIDKGLAGSGLLAEVLINKYEEHLPLYRQELRWKRIGYEIPRSTLCDWVGQCAERLKPIVDAMIKMSLLNSPKIHTDDTTIPVLEKGKTHTGRLWVYIGGGGHAPPVVIYQYSKTRRQEVPQTFLRDYQGYLQADAYPGYDKLYASKKIIEVACMAHARRYFVDAAECSTEPTLASHALERFAKLYHVEANAKDMTDLQRYYYRRRHARPILKRFYAWLKQHENATPAKSPTAKAINYALNHWSALNNYLLDGVLTIDNNAAERCMKPVVLGRKNYLFAGSHQGAENAAVIYSLIQTCKHLGINTYDYLRDVLARLPTTLNSNIEQLFPCNWRPRARH